MADEVDVLLDGDDVAYMLTTDDNPFNPFVDFAQWWTWDEIHGYRTCSRIALEYYSSPELPEWMQDQDRAGALDRVLEADLTGKLKKVSEKDFEKDLVSET